MTVPVSRLYYRLKAKCVIRGTHIVFAIHCPDLSLRRFGASCLSRVHPSVLLLLLESILWVDIGQSGLTDRARCAKKLRRLTAAVANESSKLRNLED